MVSYIYSWGGLLLASTLKEFEDPDTDADHKFPVPNTAKIKLYQADDGAERLVEIGCLPDHVLFLGLNDVLCLSAKDYRFSQRKSCILY
jgi:hypothetical protein